MHTLSVNRQMYCILTLNLCHLLGVIQLWEKYVYPQLLGKLASSHTIDIETTIAGLFLLQL